MPGDSIEESKGPKKVILQDGVNLEIYDFPGLKSKFEMTNDTTYVINFWSTWCKPCIKEMPHFEEVAKHYRDKKFKMIFVSLDFPAVYEKSLVKFLKGMGIDSECVVLDDPDGNTWIPQVDSSWSGAIPATVIYNGKKGRKFFQEGYLEKQILEKKVKLMLAEE